MDDNISTFPGSTPATSKKEVTYSITYVGVDDLNYEYSVVGHALIAGDTFLIHDDDMTPLFFIPINRMVTVFTTSVDIEEPLTAEDADVSTPN